jgi:hypothetical protein
MQIQSNLGIKTVGMFTKNKAVGDMMLRKLGNFKKSYDYGDILWYIWHIQGASVNMAILQQRCFPGAATLGQIPLSSFCCQL